MNMSKWHTVASVDSVVEGKGISVTVPGRRKPLALFKSAGNFYAVNNECPHAYALLSGSSITDGIITCSWHGAKFDARTGKPLDAAAYSDLATFPVRVSGNDVQIEF